MPNVSRRSLTDYANDKTDPKISVLSEISIICGTDLGWLATGEGSPDGKAANDPDFDLLCRAIELVEQGLSEARRVAPPYGKAEMITAAYEMLRDSGERAAPRILQLLK